MSAYYQICNRRHFVLRCKALQYDPEEFYLHEDQDAAVGARHNAEDTEHAQYCRV
jgi:hypothetical protein